MSGSGTGGFRFGNRYSALDSDNDSDTWQVQERNKRKRRSTGGSYGPSRHSLGTGVCAGAPTDTVFPVMSKSEFKELSLDDKLVTMFEAINNIGSMQGRLRKVETEVADLKLKSDAHDDRIKLVEYKSIDLEARSRRNNLIFRGHTETVGDDDCVSIIKDHLERDLGLHSELYIQRAHRLGNINIRRRRGRGGSNTIQPRPIIVQFRDYQAVELILQNAYKLTDTQYGINRDYPKEIIEARSKLWPMYKKAKGENQKGEVYIGYPAKLIVRGKVVADKFPEWRTVLRGSRVQCETARSNEEQDGEAGTHSQQPSHSSRPAPSVSNHPYISGQLNERDDDEISMRSIKSQSCSRSRSRSVSPARLTISPIKNINKEPEHVSPTNNATKEVENVNSVNLSTNFVPHTPKSPVLLPRTKSDKEKARSQSESGNSGRKSRRDNSELGRRTLAKQYARANSVTRLKQAASASETQCTPVTNKDA